MKAEYNFNTMKRKGHPLRKKVARGEIKLLKIVDIPDKEIKLAVLAPDERGLVVKRMEGL